MHVQPVLELFKASKVANTASATNHQSYTHAPIWLGCLLHLSHLPCQGCTMCAQIPGSWSQTCLYAICTYTAVHAFIYTAIQPYMALALDSDCLRQKLQFDLYAGHLREKLQCTCLLDV